MKDFAFLRLPEVLAYLPLGKTCFLNKVKKGVFPSPVKISERVNAWRVSDVRKLLADLSNGAIETGTPETKTNLKKG